jgi:hypothetical protein
MDNTKIAWLAGLIDGEGSIGMYAQRMKKRDGKYITFHRTQVTIANDDVNIVAEAQRVISEIIGRNAYVATAINNRTYVHHKVSVCPRKDCIKLLTAVEPYLIGKKAQAQILLSVLKSHRPYSTYTKAEREVIDILKKMKNDNKICADGNTEPSRMYKDSEGVETGHETSRQLEMKVQSDTP